MNWQSGNDFCQWNSVPWNNNMRTWIKLFFLIFEKMLFKPHVPALHICDTKCAIWAAKISGWYSIRNVHAIWAINEQRSLSLNICTSSLLLRAFCTSGDRGKTVHLLFEIFFFFIFFSRVLSNKNICVLSHSTYTSSFFNAPLPIFKYFDFSSLFYSVYKVIRFEEATLYSIFSYKPIFVLVMIWKRIFWGGRCNMGTNVVAKWGEIEELDAYFKSL